KHTHQCSQTEQQSVPGLVEEYSYSHLGTKIEEAAAPAAPPDPDAEIMAYARATGYPEVDIEGIHIEPSAGGWGRFMWRLGTTAGERYTLHAYVQAQLASGGPPALAG
ncbi:MAG: hypothetical protein ACRDHW_21830, partial [Ktedonobacteraceae bacterium]